MMLWQTASRILYKYLGDVETLHASTEEGFSAFTEGHHCRGVHHIMEVMAQVLSRSY